MTSAVCICGLNPRFGRNKAGSETSANRRIGIRGGRNLLLQSSEHPSDKLP